MLLGKLILGIAFLGLVVVNFLILKALLSIKGKLSNIERSFKGMIESNTDHKTDEKDEKTQNVGA